MNKSTLIIAGIAVLFAAGAFLVYSQFFTADPAEREEVLSKISIAGGISGTVEDATVTEFLMVLNRLKKIKVDTSFFEDPVFRQLKDFSVKLTTEPKGRPNPFAPLSDVEKASGPTSSTADVSSGGLSSFSGSMTR